MVVSARVVASLRVVESLFVSRVVVGAVVPWDAVRVVGAIPDEASQEADQAIVAERCGSMATVAAEAMLGL